MVVWWHINNFLMSIESVESEVIVIEGNWELTVYNKAWNLGY